MFGQLFFFNDGALAQLVEHRTENPCVPGSIPGGTTPPFIMNPCLRDFSSRGFSLNNQNKTRYGNSYWY